MECGNIFLCKKAFSYTTDTFTQTYSFAFLYIHLECFIEDQGTNSHGQFSSLATSTRMALLLMRRQTGNSGHFVALVTNQPVRFLGFTTGKQQLQCYTSGTHVQMCVGVIEKRQGLKSILISNFKDQPQAKNATGTGENIACMHGSFMCDFHH